jgi:hypothetical protein
LQAPHTVPSTPPLQKLAPVGGGPHVPTVAPAAMLQLPPQQSEAIEQTSPVWMQNDDPSEQVPLEQSFEQHSLPSAQVLPAVLHEAFRGAQVPFVHCPPQQSPAAVHAPLSEMHAAPLQVPLVQLRPQHDVAVVQLAPAGMQLLKVVAHVFVAVSQVPEQQVGCAEHRSP